MKVIPPGLQLQILPSMQPPAQAQPQAASTPVLSPSWSPTGAPAAAVPPLWLSDAVQSPPSAAVAAGPPPPAAAACEGLGGSGTVEGDARGANAATAPAAGPGCPLGGFSSPAPPGRLPEPPIWDEIGRFLINHHKPAVLAIARPDAKKNLLVLVKAFGECRPLRELANLVLVMGNRDAIDDMAPGSQAVLMSVLRTVRCPADAPIETPMQVA